MTDVELQIIMATLENHRRDFKGDLEEIKADIAKHAVIIQAHQSRFDAFDTIKGVALTVGAWLSAGVAAVWALVTFKFGGK